MGAWNGKRGRRNTAQAHPGAAAASVPCRCLVMSAGGCGGAPDHCVRAQRGSDTADMKCVRRRRIAAAGAARCRTDERCATTAAPDSCPSSTIRGVPATRAGGRPRRCCAACLVPSRLPDPARATWSGTAGRVRAWEGGTRVVSPCAPLDVRSYTDSQTRRNGGPTAEHAPQYSVAVTCLLPFALLLGAGCGEGRRTTQRLIAQ
jgi:hypothetical protein